jgi:hypothetical protein
MPNRVYASRTSASAWLIPAAKTGRSAMARCSTPPSDEIFPATAARYRFGFCVSSRMSRNSFGPLISARLRCCCSSTGIDLSTIPSAVRSAISEALCALRVFARRVGIGPASACSTSRRIASGRPGLSGLSSRQLSNRAACSGKSRTMTGMAPTFGRPRPRFFLILDIDRVINKRY